MWGKIQGHKAKTGKNVDLCQVGTTFTLKLNGNLLELIAQTTQYMQLTRRVTTFKFGQMLTMTGAKSC